MKKQLVYVMGPSGSGKDSIMKWVMQHKEPSLKLRWAQRCVTRNVNDKEGNDQFITNEKFDLLLSNHSLAMNWQAHAIRYGIEKSQLFIDDRPELILINGSRAYYSTAKSLYPDMFSILVTANLETLSKRLQERARESTDSIGQRLDRAGLIQLEKDESILEVSNEGELDQSGRYVLDHLSALFN